MTEVPAPSTSVAATATRQARTQARTRRQEGMKEGRAVCKQAVGHQAAPLPVASVLLPTTTSARPFGEGTAARSQGGCVCGGGISPE